MTDKPPLTAERIKAVRERYGHSMMDCKRLCEIADEHFDGDEELGHYWLHADSLAVMVYPDRAKWNADYARVLKQRRIDRESTNADH